MDNSEIDKAIDEFMHPVVYTGVKPILLVAEELITEKKVGDIVEAVWIGLDSNEEFSYISKFAVKGKIFLEKYHNKNEIEPFAGRLALPQRDNLKYVLMHRKILQEIKELKSKRSALLNEVHRGFHDVLDLYADNQELYLFEKKDGDWEKELFSDFNINAPYKVIKVVKRSSGLQFYLENLRTHKTGEYSSNDKFYGYFIGSMADIAGLKLKSESYLKNIESLQNDAKINMKKIQWLHLDDPSIQKIYEKLPKYPFEDYFKYVRKEDIRKMSISDDLIDTLNGIILKHMPENNTPLGMEYIPIDKLLYLFHAIIPRADALKALEACDIVYEQPAMVLGHEGKHQLPPKFLVPISHVASAYGQFESFVDACSSFSYNSTNEKETKF